MSMQYPEPPTHITDAQGPRIGSLGDRSALGLQPHTPTQHGENASTEPEDRHVDLEIKRPRACEPCRQLKVRCDPDPENPDGPCKRCAKARRQCIVTAPTRKRQKKTDSRVTELERKIDALTATLQASHRDPQFPTAGNTSANNNIDASASAEQQSPRRWLREDSHLAGAGSKRHHDGFLVSQYRRPDSPSAEQIHKQPASRHWRGPFAGETMPGARSKVQNDFIDIVDRGLIDLDTAQRSFHRYVNQMADEMPIVVFPPGTTMGDVRRDKPALFLAIIAVSVATFKKDLQMPLINECYQLIADNVVVKGRKSLELVQALLVVSIWYIPPDNLDELKFYQLIHMAIALAMELGLNRRSNGDLRPLSRLREIISKTPTTTRDMDPNGPEARRTWLGCYFLGIQVATALRRMQLVRWQPYMDESLQILETHPDALPSDRKLVWWAKLGWIMEQAGVQLTPDDTKSVVSFKDSKVRYTIKAFANQLAQYRRDIPEEVWTEPLAHTYYALNLFIHENAMGIDCRDSMLPNSPANGDLSANTIMAPLIDALTSCIESIHQALDIISNVDVERFTCLPTLSVARTAYPVVSLIKIYSLLTAPESRIGQVIDMQTLKVEYYLDKVINHYRAVAALDSGRVATKFGNILMMLRNWFVKKKGNGPELREIFGTEMRSDTPGETKPVKEGANPLHVLSELAMGDPASRPSESNRLPRPPSGHENIYQSPNPNYPDPARSPAPQILSQDSGPTKHGMSESHRIGSMTSTRGDPTSGPTASNWSSASFSPQVTVPGMSDSNMGNRTYYQQFQPTPGTSQAYGMPNAGAAAQYPSMSNVGSIPLGQSMGMFPEGPFDPDNLTALGNIMDEGLFSFPFAFDADFQF